MNSYKQIADKLTVQNLSLVFPELAEIYANKMDTKLKVDLSLDLKDKSPLVNRDLNTFIFSKLSINL